MKEAIIDHGNLTASKILIDMKIVVRASFIAYLDWTISTFKKFREFIGLLRQFFPKYTSFLAVTQEHLDWAVDLLNNRPRKCLDWKTPFQAMSEGLLHLGKH